MSSDFDRVLHAGLLHKLTSCGIAGQIFGFILPFLSNSWLRVVLNGKSSQEYPVNAGVPQGPIDLNDLNVVCNIAIYVDDTTL